MTMIPITPTKIRQVTGFDLDELWQLAFGYKGLPFPANISGDVARVSDKLNQYSRRTGVPFYSLDANGRIGFMPVWLDDKLLPLTRVGISRRNIIESDVMAGKKGTIKESISAQDYVITIQGLAFGSDRLYPEADVAMINDLCNKREALMLKNAFTDIFLTDGYVVVEDFTFPPSRTEHTQPYEIKLLSDEVFDLNIS